MRTLSQRLGPWQHHNLEIPESSTEPIDTSNGVDKTHHELPRQQSRGSLRIMAFMWCEQYPTQEQMESSIAVNRHNIWIASNQLKGRGLVLKEVVEEPEVGDAVGEERVAEKQQS